MARSKPAGFQFFPADFLTGTDLMSVSAVGAYIRMLCRSWELGPIPNNPTALKRAMGLGRGDSLPKIWSEVCTKFVQTSEGWVNERLEQSRARAEAYREKQVSNGKRGAAKRWGGNGGDDEGGEQDGQRHSEPIASATDDSWRWDSHPVPVPDPIPTPKIEVLSENQIHLLSEKTHTARARAPLRVFLPTSARPILLDADIGPPIEHPTEPPELDDPDGIPPRWSPHPSRGGGLVEDHRKCHPAAFAACERGWCIPRTLVSQWVQQLASVKPDRAAAEAYVRGVVERACKARPPGPLGDEPFDFWRAVWRAEHGVQAPVTVQANTRESRTLAAGERTKAWIRAGGLAVPFGRPS